MFDLFIELGADDETADFPVIYASGRHGHRDHRPGRPGRRTCSRCSTRSSNNVPPPDVDEDGPAPDAGDVARSTASSSARSRVGRVFAGKIRKNQRVAVVKQKDGSAFDDTVVQVLEFDRLGQEGGGGDPAPATCARSSGSTTPTSATRSATFDKPKALPPLTIDEPTLDMVFRVNDSPFAGQDGKPLTSRELRDRLDRELQHNVAPAGPPGRARERVHRLRPRAACTSACCSRTMRREGSELAVGKPRVIIKEIDGAEARAVRVPGGRGAERAHRAGDAAGAGAAGRVPEDGERTAATARSSSSTSRPAG